MEKIKKALLFVAEPILENGVPSIGRILLLITFIGCWLFWGKGWLQGTPIEIPDTLWNALAVFTGYVFGGKGIEGLSNLASVIRGKKE